MGTKHIFCLIFFSLVSLVICSLGGSAPFRRERTQWFHDLLFLQKKWVNSLGINTNQAKTLRRTKLNPNLTFVSFRMKRKGRRERLPSFIFCLVFASTKLPQQGLNLYGCVLWQKPDEEEKLKACWQRACSWSLCAGRAARAFSGGFGEDDWGACVATVEASWQVKDCCPDGEWARTRKAVLKKASQYSALQVHCWDAGNRAKARCSEGGVHWRGAWNFCAHQKWSDVWKQWTQLPPQLLCFCLDTPFQEIGKALVACGQQ